MRAVLPLISWVFLSPAFAQASEGTLMDRVNSINQQTPTEADCKSQVDQAEILNGPDLLVGSAICLAADESLESSFLLNVGQTRSLVDLVLMVPATSADSDVQTDLYSFIYFYAGGFGPDEILVEPSLRNRFFALLDDWSPSYSAEYDPGWDVRRRPDAVEYQDAVDEVRADRRQQLTDLAQLYSDEVYYSLQRRLQELQTQTGGRYVEGTPEAELSMDLQRQMSDRAQVLGIALGVRNEPPDTDIEDVADRFPPAAPTPDEMNQGSSDDPTVKRCADLAERHTIADESRVVRILITRSERWGTIWRADIEGGDQSPTRFTCTESTSSSRPMELGEESVSPLPESGASETTPQ